VAQDQNNRKKKPHQVELIGSAILKKDNFKGKRYWVTWDGEGNNEVAFSGGQPLIFPPEQLQIGTKLHLIPPEE